MKNVILALAAVATLAGFTTVAEAGNYCRPVHHCAPKVYKIRTCEINRCYHWRTSYDHCGHPFRYRVAVITYKDHYSNGTWRTWTRTVRA